MNEFLRLHPLRFLAAILLAAALLVSSAEIRGLPSAFADTKASGGAAKSAKPKTETKEIIAHDGLYLGHVVLIDKKGRYIFLRPFEGHSSRRTFYLDKQTLFRKEGRTVKLTEFHIGSTVGVRFVSEGGISYAEGVFLIEGEINPQELQMPKKKIAPSESAPKAEKAENPSGHH